VTFDYVPLIARFGYLATFVGTVLEGETLLVLSGLLAHRGYLSLPLVVAAGAAGGALGDLGFFLVGRHYGDRLLARFPRFAPAKARVAGLIERHPAFAIVAVRFMYGVRIAGPAIIGTTRIPLARFAAFNVAGAIVWSACWATAGYAFGRAAEAVLGDLARYERALLLGLLLAAAVASLTLHLRARRDRRRS
jgi:membrane protein DedA with SNARE-associated domain